MITSVSHGVKKIIIDDYKIDRAVEVIPNGFDANLLHAKDQKKKFDTCTLICHGNLARFQNVELLLTIARKCPNDIDFIVAGDGFYEKKVQNEKKIKYMGRLSYDKVSSIVAKSHIGLSFLKDGFIGDISFPVRIFEYIGAGLPVISIPRNDAGAFLEENQLGYQFDTHEVEEIIKAILRIKENYASNTPPPYLSRQSQAKLFSKVVREASIGERL